MTRPGPKPTPPQLALVRGNPGKRAVRQGPKLAPERPLEPRWVDFFPAVRGALRGENQRARSRASAEWRWVVPVLDHHGLLTKVDRTVVVDYCICVARLDQAERDISRRGLHVDGVRNPAVVAANQYRQQLRFYVGEFGLAPSSRGRLDAGDGNDEGAEGLLD